MLRFISLSLPIIMASMPVVRGQSDPNTPFPGNRVNGFYQQQAQDFLASGRSHPTDLLPQFPGLDGGGFGHWGQNPEDASFDRSLNEANTGNLVCQLIRHFGKVTPKGVSVLIDEATGTSVLFDPEQLTVTDAWQGGFVEWGFVRFGLMQGVAANGTQLGNSQAARWLTPAQTPIRYRGFYRCGKEVIFACSIGNASILQHAAFSEGCLLRRLEIFGSLPSGTALVLAETSADQNVTAVNSAHGSSLRITRQQSTEQLQLSVVTGEATLSHNEGIARIDVQSTPRTSLLIQQQFGPPKADLQPAKTAAQPVLTQILESLAENQYPKSIPPQWADQTVTTTAVPADNSVPLAIDTLPLPHFPNNPFGSAMRIGGVGVLQDGRIAVATLMGEVWICSGTENIESAGQLTWQRVAAGLYRGLGLTVQNDRILVLGSDQITRLHDLNGDGEADFYECVTNEYPTTGGHDFCTSLQQNAQGELYWSVSAHDFGVAHRDSSGHIRSLGSGLRNSNGIGVSPAGDVVLATVQEGTWTPATAIFEVSPDSYHGLQGPKPNRGKYGYDLPLCYIPRGIDNSSGEVRYLPSDDRLGPLSGAVLGTSFGACQSYLVLRDVVDGRSQGAVVPLPGDYLSGVCRTAFSETDGCIYIAGTEGWQSYATEDGCLQRIRPADTKLTIPQTFESWNNGLRIQFSEMLDPNSITAANVFCQQWNYLYSAAYGSPEFSVRQPERQGHDYVPVKSVHLLDDGRSVFVEIPQLHPVMQFHFHAQFRTANGSDFQSDLFATILSQREDFTDFSGYAAVKRRPVPDFPRPETPQQDPRLTEQEKYGTNFGWVSSSQKLSVEAAPGLQYTPQILRVAPGARVSLAFHNADPGMPHNVAVVRADAIDDFGTRSMQLASNPRAIATHYVPDDPREICFSPILQPGDTYTMFFEAPQEPGEYRLVCTYPGHWRVMQAALFVIPDAEPLPEVNLTPTRSFVRMWTMNDLSDAADQLNNSSAERGARIFTEAGCIRCHKMNNQGSPLGPDLTAVSRKYRGHGLLQQILQPSTEINRDYQTWVAVLTDGRALSGIKTAESAQSVTLLPNPLQLDSAVTLNRDDIDELVASATSTMPENLLITYSRQEILDLLLYLQHGDPNPVTKQEQ